MYSPVITIRGHAALRLAKQNEATFMPTMKTRCALQEKPMLIKGGNYEMAMKVLILIMMLLLI